MSSSRVLFRRPGELPIYALLRRHADFGIEELDLLRPPARFWADGAAMPRSAELNVDGRRVAHIPTPAALLAGAAGNGGAAMPGDGGAATSEPWAAMAGRSLARLLAWFLIIEDPRQRLEAKPIVTLAHQASVVQHILEQPRLRRVLLADEVGLGKTVEAGLLIAAVLARNPGARVLYLAPARLVRNVRHELDRLGLGFVSWVATADRDAMLTDPRVIASIHRACHRGHFDAVVQAPPWDMIVVDECHHLSDWSSRGSGGSAQYKLVEHLAKNLDPDSGRLLLMSGTPHQGHAGRFRNLLRLLRTSSETEAELAGRVIYRTKEDVRDWQEQPLFPKRHVAPPVVVDLGPDYRAWLAGIHALYELGATEAEAGVGQAQQGGDAAVVGRRSGQAKQDGDPAAADGRAAGWRSGQALQWATSSVQAGMGYLIRQAIRARCQLDALPGLAEALAAIRPYRLGAADEPIQALYARMAAEVRRQSEDADVEDIEELESDNGLDDDSSDSEQPVWQLDQARLSALVQQGVRLLETTGDARWELIFQQILAPAGADKVVLFAQPIETVTAISAYLERVTGQRPAMIIGGQTEAQRSAEVARFWAPHGPQYLVSSRAGGEGLNLQIARRLVHLDVPWNPMELEQRIGRVHRFMSRQTILVDTIVVKDSREVDAYACAREKLQTIASTMVTEERFEALFGRVMSLVPPEELQHILGQSPMGPLGPQERERISELVIRGFQEWQRFHRKYAAHQRQIRALDPGQARWADLAAFAKRYLGATDAEGFSALGFAWQGHEVISEPRPTHVLDIHGKPYACGDTSGMPVMRQDGTRAERLGTNVDFVAQALREHAFPGQPTGAAYLKWPAGQPRPRPGLFAVLIFARQSVRWEQGAYTEHAASLHCVLVTMDGQQTTVAAHETGNLIRVLLGAAVLPEPAAESTGLARMLQRIEADISNQLCSLTDTDQEASISHAVTPLLAAVVA